MQVFCRIRKRPEVSQEKLCLETARGEIQIELDLKPRSHESELFQLAVLLQSGQIGLEVYSRGVYDRLDEAGWPSPEIIALRALQEKRATLRELIRELDTQDTAALRDFVGRVSRLFD